MVSSQVIHRTESVPVEGWISVSDTLAVRRRAAAKPRCFNYYAAQWP